MKVRDDERLVEYEEFTSDDVATGVAPIDDGPVLPRSTRDDTDAGWGERASGNEDRLLAERPPHWGD